MTMTMDEFQKILDETYDRHFGDFMKIVEEVNNERKSKNLDEKKTRQKDRTDKILMRTQENEG